MAKRKSKEQMLTGPRPEIAKYVVREGREVDVFCATGFEVLADGTLSLFVINPGGDKVEIARFKSWTACFRLRSLFPSTE